MRPPIAPSNFATFSFLLCLLLKRVLQMTEKKNSSALERKAQVVLDYEQRTLRRSLITITDPRPQHLLATQPYQLEQSLQLVVRQTALGAEGRELLQANVWSQENKMGLRELETVVPICQT